MGRVQDKVALVTGSAQGMGFAIARCLLEEGAKVMINDINQETIDRAVDELNKEFPGRVVGKKADVTNKAQVQEMIDELVRTWGSIDILVNNAGGSLHTPYKLEEIEEKHWDLVLNVNLKGAFFTCQSAIPYMAKAGKGAIVNMGALAGHWRASLAGVQYTAAKAGVEGLTRQLAYDWGQKGIRVNCVAPTVTITGERMKGLWEDRSEEEREKIVANIPLRRLSTPDEIGKAVVFLASDDASYITGITLDVVGGRYLR
ncbi:MAG TPA: SDR family oxidoreductase [Firmicutes bacterium]|uniref:SDR family oxidoreductase n=1 Tax=Capillibacterium thermochitinicola TaxID=2699427 RepID=A0A8J6LT57_9FIRM|nr:SDR family NAD(P)-dependent oxidoreductase [Capillibacterium thermochitinicola]MBA2133997.1 SDR family oxidoreductase [Capillibacterium thermochitinicola]HHW11438.1 SDR family oxidoreductase [Bacillota bacterium]